MTKFIDSIKEKFETQKTNRYIRETSKADYNDYIKTSNNSDNYLYGVFNPNKVVSIKTDRCTQREEVYTEDNLIIKTEFSETLGGTNLSAIKYQGIFPAKESKSGKISLDPSYEKMYVSVEKISIRGISNYITTISNFDKDNFSIKVHNNNQEPPKEFSDLFNEIESEFNSSKALIESENISDSPEA